MNKTFNANDYLPFADKTDVHGLRGHVQVFRKNNKTGETSLWYENDNTIVLSGYQFILMKCFGLHLDSIHGTTYEDLDKDTNLVVPDLNNSGAHQIGVDPSEYTTMNSEIGEDHIIQGFMIGNGGAGEDAITSKNTNYSFTKLRNPIPFQQTQTSLSASIAGKYLGVLRVGTSSFSKSYYIKKFDSTPHIYHSWWKDGQKWDYIDPVSQNDLGPDAVNGSGKTNRIETYIQCQMSLEDDDCISYFNHEGNTQTPMVNELGLVAFDAVYGSRSIVERLYNSHIKTLLSIIYDKNRDSEIDEYVIELASEITTVLENNIGGYAQSNINNFIDIVASISSATVGNIDYDAYMTALSDEDNINVDAYYNQDGTYVYEEDKFLEYLSDSAFDRLTTDEAQRIKLVTYYTFNSIPLQENWSIIINYRIYAN